MSLALEDAFLTQAEGETPVGALLLSPDGDILARARNRPIALNDPTAHAEILAIRQACRDAGNYRLSGAVLVVTLEPCLMCLGAIVHARLGGLVFGARDPKAGAVASRLQADRLDFLNHRVPILEGVMAEACGDVLKRFFMARRREKFDAESGEQADFRQPRL